MYAFFWSSVPRGGQVYFYHFFLAYLLTIQYHYVCDFLRNLFLCTYYHHPQLNWTMNGLTWQIYLFQNGSHNSLISATVDRFPTSNKTTRQSSNTNLFCIEPSYNKHTSFSKETPMRTEQEQFLSTLYNRPLQLLYCC